MELQIYNSVSRKKELFEPIDKNRVTMYVCGPTVYNRVHVGNARPAVIFDTLFRLLKYLYPQVIYARNITDVDDKIIEVAKNRGQKPEDIAKLYADFYFSDMAFLNCQTPTIQPFATKHIPEMLDMIEVLISNGFAYVSEKHVLFSVASMPNYGKFSGTSLQDLTLGARVEIGSYKRDANDFVLWKPSKKGEPAWNSPWGRGRPGWHIECSAMAQKHLGITIDIHGGGLDLLFPHHENESAQSCCANGGKPLANFWMHNGFIQLDGKKMSKSVGNFRLVCDLLENYPGEVLRYVILSAHYRSEQQFNTSLLDSAKRSLDTLYGCLKATEDLSPVDVDPQTNQGFRALLDDLNTPVSISELHSLARLCRQGSKEKRILAKAQLLSLARFLGLLQTNPDDWFKEAHAPNALSETEIDEAIILRQKAKESKNFNEADRIRDLLAARGVILEDGRNGTSWRRQ